MHLGDRKFAAHIWIIYGYDLKSWSHLIYDSIYIYHCSAIIPSISIWLLRCARFPLAFEMSYSLDFEYIVRWFCNQRSACRCRSVRTFFIARQSGNAISPILVEICPTNSQNLSYFSLAASSYLRSCAHTLCVLLTRLKHECHLIRIFTHCFG